jgi:hypothetical protein
VPARTSPTLVESFTASANTEKKVKVVFKTPPTAAGS